MAYNYYPPNKIQGETAVYDPDEYLSYEEDGWAHEDGWEYEEEWAYEEELIYDDEPLLFFEETAYPPQSGQSAMRPELLIIPAVLLTLLLLLFLGQGISISAAGEQVAAVETAVSPDISFIGGASSSFIAPYDDYVLTQGLHGYSYGHMAIDLAAGVGATIKAPITGEITELYTDAYNNPTLVIENDRYKVMFLHGNYTAVLGQTFKQGDAIGAEGNNGYTMDSAGNLCYGRAGCGYHTHLNVFDKQLGQNVNPLDLINK